MAKQKIDTLIPSILATEEGLKPSYSMIRQGTVTNQLTKTKPSTKRNTTIDPITGTATITQGSLTITIPHFEELMSFKTSTHQLLDALTEVFTAQGASTPAVSLSLEEYMSKRGLKDRKEARKQADSDLETLFNAKISFKEKRRKGGEQDYHDMRIIDSKGIQNGVINVTFGSTFSSVLSGYPVMPYPTQLYRLGKKNPNSYYFLRKLSEHKNMNIETANEDIIAVKTLLTSTPNLPTYEEVMATGRQITQRIIEPFERDMNALEDTLSWHYCHRNGEPLTDEELSKELTYEAFEKLLIKATWREDYPENEARRKEIRAKRAKKRTSKKK